MALASTIRKVVLDFVSRTRRSRHKTMRLINKSNLEYTTNLLGGRSPSWYGQQKQYKSSVKHPSFLKQLFMAMYVLSRLVKYATPANFSNQIFGFQFTISHENTDWDPSEQINLRHRLPTRAIRVKGLPRIETLYPYLQARLNRTIAQQIEAQTNPYGNELSVR